VNKQINITISNSHVTRLSDVHTGDAHTSAQSAGANQAEYKTDLSFPCTEEFTDWPSLASNPIRFHCTLYPYFISLLKHVVQKCEEFTHTLTTSTA
jgi:hypothetical protein